MKRVVFHQHAGGLVPLWAEQDIQDTIDAKEQIYRLGDWPYLLKRCGCPGAPEPSDAYEPIAPEEALEWLQTYG